jgi:hypothetical protein
VSTDSPFRFRFLRWLPWRLAAPGWVVLVVIAAVGVPLFVRMPLWCDATLYDVAARNVLDGGVHYRDVFDTNPPGFVWLVCLIRATCGWSPEVMRAADLLVVAGATALLLRWAKAAGADPAARAWTAAAVAGFYLFTSEFSQVQRDVWMMLPACAAVLVRLRRIERMRAGPTSGGRVFWGAMAEAAIWGCGFWVKPHLGLVALAVWLATAPALAASGRWPLRRLGADVLGQLAGLALVAAAGAGWLVATGAWPHYLDVNRNWNTGYWDVIRAEQADRNEFRFGYFPPWSAGLRVALPLAAVNLIAGLVRCRRTDDPRWTARAALGAALLAWFAIGLYLQRPFRYVHVPEIVLMLAVFAANRWAVAFWLIALRVAAGLFLLYAADRPEVWAWHGRRCHESAVYRDVLDPLPGWAADRLAWWRRCFGREVPRELRLGVALEPQELGGTDSVQLGAVEDFLRAEGVKDGELLCWHEATHPLYLSLNVRPPVRFMHVGTAMGMGRWQREQVAAEVRRAMPGVRFVVSDLHRVTWQRDALLDLAPDGLPWAIPAWQRTTFPFDQPVVFRSPGGRYLVHRVVHPVRECIIPDGLDQDEPPPGYEYLNPRPRRGWRD